MPARAARAPGSSSRSAPHAIAEPQLAGAASGWVPSWRFKDVRTGRHFTRQVASCGTIRRPVQFSGLGMVNIVTVNFAKGLQAAQSTSLMADAQIVYGSPTSLYIATQKWVTPTLSLGQLPAVAGHRDRQVRRQRSRHDDVPLERRGARLPAQPVLALRERRVPARREHEPADLVGPGPRRRPARAT